MADMLEDTEATREGSEGLFDLLGEIPGAGGLGIANGVANAYKGGQELAAGEWGDGLLDLGQGLGGTVKGGMDLMKDFGLGQGAGDVGRAVDVASGAGDIAHGFWDIASDEGYGGGTLDGIHDILSGSGDLASGFFGEDSQIGMAGKGLSAGIKVGDALAPYVFHDAASEGAHQQAIPADGWQTTTGNASVDHLVHGAQALGDGQLATAGTELLQGAPLAAQMMINPVGAIAGEALGGAIASLWE